MEGLLLQFWMFMSHVLLQDFDKRSLPLLRLNFSENPEDITSRFNGSLLLFQLFQEVNSGHSPNLNQSLTGILSHPLILALFQNVEEVGNGPDLEGSKNGNDGCSNLLF